MSISKIVSLGVKQCRRGQNNRPTTFIFLQIQKGPPCSRRAFLYTNRVYFAEATAKENRCRGKLRKTLANCEYYEKDEAIKFSSS